MIKHINPKKMSGEGILDAKPITMLKIYLILLIGFTRAHPNQATIVEF